MEMCINCFKTVDDPSVSCPHCGYNEGDIPPYPQALPPRTKLLHRYVIGRQIGSGPLAFTYIAWDSQLERCVVIRECFPSDMVRRESDGRGATAYPGKDNVYQEYKKMFLDESLRLAQLSGVPGVVNIYDCFEENSIAYNINEYLTGETLMARINREKKIDWKECLDITLKLLDTLERIHDAGLIHRDISPYTLMLCENSRVVLLDSCLSRNISNAFQLSTATIRIGYAPPEQYNINGHQGTWTDVYGAAATMYHALTGVTPPDAYYRVTRDTLKRPFRLAKIPRRIGTAILNAMNLSVADRTQTPAEFAAELTGKVRVRRRRDRKK